MVEAEQNRLVPVALVVGVTAIAFAAIFFRLAAPTHPLAMSCLRLSMASALLSPLVVRAWRRGRLSSRQVRAAALAGVMYAVHFGAWVSSLTLTSVASSVTLVTATPLLLAIVGLATGRDRPDRRLGVALSLSLVGLAIIGGQDLAISDDALLGDGLAILGAAAMAGYLLIARDLGEELDVWAFSGIATGVGALTLAATTVAAGVSLEPASMEAFGFIVLATLVPQLIGHTLLTWCLRVTRPTVVGIATLGEPVGSSALAWVLLGEALEGWGVVGCAVTLAAVFIAIRRPRRDAADDAQEKARSA